MNIEDIKAVYFVGAGGIGMSAIARYFLKKGLVVAGYDKTPSDLTRSTDSFCLSAEGFVPRHLYTGYSCRAQRTRLLP